MRNGNIREFVDKLWGGEELIYIYNGKKYFSQGYVLENGQYRFELQQWEPEGKTLWYVEGFDPQSSLDKFLEQPLFDGKNSGKRRQTRNGWIIKKIKVSRGTMAYERPTSFLLYLLIILLQISVRFYLPFL